MLLVDVENLAGITIPKEQEAAYEARLAAAIDQAKEYCKNPFEDQDGKQSIPAGAQMGIALMVKAMGEKNQNVASQSLGDMSKSFFQNGTYDAAIKYLKPYRRARYI